jgi:hypothetical protein
MQIHMSLPIPFTSFHRCTQQLPLNELPIGMFHPNPLSSLPSPSVRSPAPPHRYPLFFPSSLWTTTHRYLSSPVSRPLPTGIPHPFAPLSSLWTTLTPPPPTPPSTPPPPSRLSTAHPPPPPSSPPPGQHRSAGGAARARRRPLSEGRGGAGRGVRGRRRAAGMRKVTEATLRRAGRIY